MVNKPLMRPYFWGGQLEGVGWPAMIRASWRQWDEHVFFRTYHWTNVKCWCVRNTSWYGKHMPWGSNHLLRMVMEPKCYAEKMIVVWERHFHKWIFGLFKLLLRGPEEVEISFSPGCLFSSSSFNIFCEYILRPFPTSVFSRGALNLCGLRMHDMLETSWCIGCEHWQQDCLRQRLHTQKSEYGVRNRSVKGNYSIVIGCLL